MPLIPSKYFDGTDVPEWARDFTPEDIVQIQRLGSYGKMDEFEVDSDTYPVRDVPYSEHATLNIWVSGELKRGLGSEDATPWHIINAIAQGVSITSETGETMIPMPVESVVRYSKTKWPETWAEAERKMNADHT